MRSSMTRFWVAVAAILIVGVVGVVLLNSKSPGPSGGPGPSASPATPGASASTSAAASASVAPTATLSPTSAGPALCGPSVLSATITGWDGAAGHRIATVELRNTGAEACFTKYVDRPELVGGDGTVLIEGITPVISFDVLDLAPSEKVTTTVQDGNYCGPMPIAPVTVAFVLGTGAGRIVATPLTPTDIEGIPPCVGDPGSAGNIQMQPWAR